MGKDNKKIVLSVFLLIFAACERNEKAERIERAGKNGKAEKNEKAGKNEKAERIERAGTAEKNTKTGRIEKAGKNGTSWEEWEEFVVST